MAKQLTVRQLHNEFSRKLKQYFGPSSTWREYGATEQGGKRIMGPHSEIRIPGARPLSKVDLEFLTKLYAEYIDERNVGVTVHPVQFGSGVDTPGFYTEINIEHRKLTPHEIDMSVPVDYTK